MRYCATVILKLLPHGTILAILPFNLCISDMPTMQSRKFGYVDDWGIGTHTQKHENNSKQPNSRLEDSWRLLPKMETETKLYQDGSLVFSP